MLTIADIKRMVLASCAIYVSDDFIDIAKGNVAPNGGLDVRYLARFPLLKNIKGVPYENAEEEIDGILAKVFENKEDMPYRVAINLRNEFFILRRFAFREIPDSELKAAVIFESQKYIHMPIEDLSFAFQKCTKKEGLQEIIFIASETKNIQGAVSYFAKHNIIASVIEPTPVLISRMLKSEGTLKKENAYISIHYEPVNKIMLTGIWHGQPHFFKEANVFPQDEEFKTAELTYPTLRDVWPMIESEVFGSIEYLRKETKKDIEKVFVSGFSGPAEDESISKELGIPFERFRLSRFKPAPADNADRFVPTLSLLHDTISPSSLNLAPDEVKHRDFWTFKPVVVKACLALLVIFLLHFVFAAANLAETLKIAALKRNFDSYKIISPEASQDDVLRYKSAMEERVAFINSLVSGRMSLAEKLNELPESIIQSSWIDAISFTNSIGKTKNVSLKIIGGIYLPRGAGSDEVNDMLLRMKKDPKLSGGFKGADIVSVKNKKLLDKEITEFEIIFK